MMQTPGPTSNWLGMMLGQWEKGKAAKKDKIRKSGAMNMEQVRAERKQKSKRKRKRKIARASRKKNRG